MTNITLVRIPHRTETSAERSTVESFAYGPRGWRAAVRAWRQASTAARAAMGHHAASYELMVEYNGRPVFLDLRYDDSYPGAIDTAVSHSDYMRAMDRGEVPAARVDAEAL